MIEVKNIRKCFDHLQVLKGVSLSISPGEMVSIVGPSGAGKTTLLQIMGTLETPDSGTVEFDGVNPFQLNSSKLARFRNDNIGFVFQFHRLLPEFSLLENVALPSLIAGVKRSDSFGKARKLIKYLGLESRENHHPSELSGGERQRAAVARALMRDPKVVLADEPSGSLDSKNRTELHRLFFDLREDMGQTFVIVTHDEHLAADTDRCIVLNDGLITEIKSQNNN